MAMLKLRKQRTPLSLLGLGACLILVLCPFISFVTLKALDEGDLFIGDSAVILDSADQYIAPEEFYRELEEFTDNSGITISKFQAGSFTARDAVVLYAAGEKAPEHTEQLPSFSRGRAVEISPLSDLDSLDPRGYYYLSGRRDSGERFLEWAQSRGLDGQVLVASPLEFFAGMPVVKTLVLLLVTCLILGIAYVLNQSQMFGVHRLQGLTLGDSARLALRELARTYALPGALVLAAVLVGLYFYNGWAFLPYYLFITVVLSVLGLAVLACGYVIGYAFLMRGDIVGQVKGKFAPRGTFVGVFLLRCATISLVLALLVSAAGFGAEKAARAEFNETWERHSDTYEAGVAVGTDGLPVATDQKLRTLDAQGKLLLVKNDWLTWPSDLGAPVLLVSQEVARQAGVHVGDDAQVEVFSPFPLGKPEKDLIDESLSFEAAVADDDMPGASYSVDATPRDVFTYDVEFNTVVSDPILVVLPTGLAPISDKNLSAWISQSSLMFKDRSAFIEMQQTQEERETLVAARPRIDSWLARERQVAADARDYVLNLVLGVLLTTGLVVAMALAFQSSRREQLWVAYLIGRNPWKQRGLLLLAEAFIALLSLGWLINHARLHEQLVASHMPSTWTIGFENSFTWPIAGAAATAIAAWAILTLVLVPVMESRESQNQLSRKDK